MIGRFLADTLAKSKKSVLLLGPRQVGKSTLLASLAPDLEINLANEAEYLNFADRAEELEARIEEQRPRTVWIDEVQRLPALLNTAQALIDRDQRLKFYFSGSSARKLRRGAANLLPGRLFHYRLGPLSCLELGFKMDTRRALELGSMPEAYVETRAHAEKLLRSYSASYLQEEILAEAVTRRIQGFSRFLRTAAETSGQFLDFSKMAARAKVNRSAARRYYELLEDTLLCDRVDAFPSEKHDLVKHPKYFFFDNGVVNAALDNFKASADRKGLLLEHLFFNQLKNVAYCLDKHIEIFHFRTRNGLEVDFVVQIDGKTYLVEIKSSSPSKSELAPLLSARSYFQNPLLIAACAEPERRKLGDIRVVGWQDAIKGIFEVDDKQEKRPSKKTDSLASVARSLRE